MSKKSAIVTGAASGIGLASSELFAKNGWNVLMTDINVTTGRKEASRLEEKYPGAVNFVESDVRSEESIASIFDKSLRLYGGLNALINNAGVGGAFGPVEDIRVRDWDYTFDVLVRAPFIGLKYAARNLDHGGCVINIASAAAFSGGTSPMAYTAAKTAVIGLTRSAAVELAPRGIRVNAVAPGVVRTPLFNKALPPEREHVPPTAQPIRRWGLAEDVAKSILFLVGPDSGFITGEVLVVDGGLVAAGPGEEFLKETGTDARTAGYVGVNRGSSGEAGELWHAWRGK